MKRLCLIDVSAMYFRAFYAIRPLSNSQGLPTNALYGFLSMTSKMLRDLKPDYLAYCFDRKDGSFRNEMYSEYKANRSEMPAELVPQVPYISKITEALQIPSLDLVGYEADDIIGMLSKMGEDQDVEVIIVSGDKDFAQLIDGRIKMFDPMKEIMYDPKAVKEKWGIEPTQVLDYLAIVGDASDNIPGIKGIGPKGAVKLLTDYKSLDGIYESLNLIHAKALKEKLISQKENAYLSKKLAAIVRENHTEITSVEDLKWGGPDAHALRVLLEELEFKNIGQKLLEDSAYVNGGVTKVEVEEKKESKWSEDDLQKYKVETLNLDGFSSQLKSSIANAYLYLVSEFLCLVDEDKKQIYQVAVSELEALEKPLESSLSMKGHDLKSLWRSFAIDSASCSFDSMIAEYLITSKSIGSLQSIVANYIGDANSKELSVVELHLSFLYIEKEQWSKLKDYSCDKAFVDVELPVVSILYKMEMAGICVDKDILAEQGYELVRETDNIRKQVFDHCSQEFNLDSPKQLGKVLFEDLKMPVIKKNKTGYSTNSEVLLKLKSRYPWVAKIIQYRELQKLLNTYIHSLPDLIQEKDGRIHTHFNQAVTATGRLSSTEPNLQNIPIRTEYGNAIRKAFIAPEGMKLVSADYSQIELRLLAHITEDPGLCKAFAEDRDIHSATAAEVFEVDFKDVDSEMRRRAKAVNFGIAYGMGAFSLADNLDISRKEAKDIIDRYFERFHGVQNYMSEIVEEAKEKTYVESLFGRRRYIPELFSSNAILRKNGERMAINTPMQASASDIVKKAMVDISKDLPFGRMLLQVHDELIFEVEASKAEDLARWVKEKMEKVVELRVPLKVNTNIGSNWMEAH